VFVYQSVFLLSFSPPLATMKKVLFASANRVEAVRTSNARDKFLLLESVVKGQTMGEEKRKEKAKLLY
jgi:hypothetical protein